MQIAQNEQWQRGDWEYTWSANGSLVEYEYDALGRRTKKMDILDLHSKFGNKYDVSVHQMLDDAYHEGLITKRQRNKLKKIKCK